MGSRPHDGDVSVYRDRAAVLVTAAGFYEEEPVLVPSRSGTSENVGPAHEVALRSERRADEDARP
jgi:hypothetical protein